MDQEKRVKEWISALMYVPRTRNEFSEFLIGEGISEEDRQEYLYKYDLVMEDLRDGD